MVLQASASECFMHMCGNRMMRKKYNRNSNGSQCQERSCRGIKFVRAKRQPWMCPHFLYARPNTTKYKRNLPRTRSRNGWPYPGDQQISAHCWPSVGRTARVLLPWERRTPSQKKASRLFAAVALTSSWPTRPPWGD